METVALGGFHGFHRITNSRRWSQDRRHVAVLTGRIHTGIIISKFLSFRRSLCTWLGKRSHGDRWKIPHVVSEIHRLIHGRTFPASYVSWSRSLIYTTWWHGQMPPGRRFGTTGASFLNAVFGCPNLSSKVPKMPIFSNPWRVELKS